MPLMQERSRDDRALLPDMPTIHRRQDKSARHSLENGKIRYKDKQWTGIHNTEMDNTDLLHNANMKGTKPDGIQHVQRDQWRNHYFPEKETKGEEEVKEKKFANL